jgi:hypothetical protein
MLSQKITREIGLGKLTATDTGPSKTPNALQMLPKPTKSCRSICELRKSRKKSRFSHSSSDLAAKLCSGQCVLSQKDTQNIDLDGNATEKGYLTCNVSTAGNDESYQKTQPEGSICWSFLREVALGRVTKKTDRQESEMGM